MRFLSAKAYGFAPYVPVFAEGAPAFPGSFLSEGFHVQLAVRDTDLIGNVDVVPAGFLGPAPPPRAAGATANAVSPVVDPEDAGETMRRYFENASDGDLADDIRRAARQPQQVDRWARADARAADSSSARPLDAYLPDRPWLLRDRPLALSRPRPAPTVRP